MRLDLGKEAANDHARRAARLALAAVVMGGCFYAAVLSRGAAFGQETVEGVVQEQTAPPIVLRGRVLDPMSRPLAGAALFLSVDEYNDPVELGVTDANGAYRFDVPNATLQRTVSGSFSQDRKRAAILATARGFGSGWAELRDVEGGRYGAMQPEYASDIRLVEDHPIEGRVVDASGAAVAGAEVGVEAILELEPLWYKLPQAIVSNDVELMSREQADVNNWGTPLYATAWRAIPAATTDADGRFTLRGVGDERAVRLNVGGPGLRDMTFSVVTRDDATAFTQALRAKYPRTPRPDGYFYPERQDRPDGDQGVRVFGPEPTIDVDPARTISGVVRDAKTGKPIPGIRMQTADAFGAGRSTTDREGRYRIVRAEASDSITLFLYNDPHETYQTVVRELRGVAKLGDVTADFDIPRAVVLHGRVVEAGTDAPIASGHRQGCHDVGPGPLVAGYIDYYPLASNAALRGSETGLYYEGLPRGSQNYNRSAMIDGDGRFRLAVPPGPGVLLVRTQPGSGDDGMGNWEDRAESEGVHRRYRYVPLARRAAADGAPGGGGDHFDGFAGPIPLGKYNAYRVIDPAADVSELDVTVEVPLGPARVVRFVDADGAPLADVTARGLAAPPHNMGVVLDGAETEVLALEAGKPRQLVAYTAGGKFAARAFVELDDEGPANVTLEPTATVSGRLIDAATGKPLAAYMVTRSHPVGLDEAPVWMPIEQDETRTDAEGRFTVGPFLPRVRAALAFTEPKELATGRPFGSPVRYQAESLPKLVLEPGENRELGEIAITLRPEP
jgi:hypothetical protein